jgi:protease PrsW
MDATTGILLSICLGFVPMFFFAWFVYSMDRYEKEPLMLLGGVFLWGAMVAAGGAFIINTATGIGIFSITGSEVATDFAIGSLVAPVVEECLKGFAVLIVFLVFRREFDSILDGLIYAAVAALGFAATENAFYIYNYGYTESGGQGIVALFIVRVFLVGWQHPFYTSFTGIGLALARLNRSCVVKLIAPLAGLSLAMVTHAFHNTLASFIGGLGGLAIGTLVDWTGWFFMFLIVVWAVLREKRWLKEYLREEVSLNILSPDQYRVACSGTAQWFAGLSALFSGRGRATRRFYQLTAELAHKKRQLATLGDESGNRAIVEQLRSELVSLGAEMR